MAFELVFQIPFGIHVRNDAHAEGARLRVGDIVQLVQPNLYDAKEDLRFYFLYTNLEKGATGFYFDAFTCNLNNI